MTNLNFIPDGGLDRLSGVVETLNLFEVLLAGHEGSELEASALGSFVGILRDETERALKEQQANNAEYRSAVSRELAKMREWLRQPAGAPNPDAVDEMAAILKAARTRADSEEMEKAA